jgi:hypothetical protein
MRVPSRRRQALQGEIQDDLVRVRWVTGVGEVRVWGATTLITLITLITLLTACAEQGPVPRRRAET